MDILLIILWAILCILAIIGSILPILPGPLLAYIAFILLQLTSAHPFSWTFFIIRGLIIIFLTVLDYVIPSRGTKRFGWSKWGVRGSNIGLIIAVVILPILGITIGPFWLIWLVGGPFLGAYLGEKYGWKQHTNARRAARGSFIWFLAWSFLKIIVSIIMAGYFFVNVYKLFIK